MRGNVKKSSESPSSESAGVTGSGGGQGSGTGSGQTGSGTGSTGSTDTTPATPAVPDSVGDRQVLEAAYNSTGGPGWSDDTHWLSSQPMGQWAGVITESGYVTELNLGSNGLTGEIPGRLGHLTELQSANIRGNDFSGCIPYSARLRSALSRSYNSGPAAQEPGWDLVILHAIHDTLIEEFGLEAVRTSEESLGWQTFLDATYGLGLAPCPPPPPARGIVPYARQYDDTDRDTLLAVRDHFLGNCTPASSFESWQGEMQSDAGIGPLRSGWRGVTLDAEGRVVKLWLDERDLRGDMPAALGNLGELRRLSLDDNPFLSGDLPLELGNLTNLKYIYLQDTGFTGCLPPPVRQNFSPTLASLLNELLQDLTSDRLKFLMLGRIDQVATARGFVQDVDEIGAYAGESFDLYMLFAPLNQGLNEVSRAVSVVSLDTLIKPGSTLSNLGNVRLTC